MVQGSAAQQFSSAYNLIIGGGKSIRYGNMGPPPPLSSTQVRKIIKGKRKKRIEKKNGAGNNDWL